MSRENHGTSRLNLGTCRACGKLTYSSRKLAKRAARQGHPGDHLTTYLCEKGGVGWHIGHLPQSVVAGKRPLYAELRREQRAARAAAEVLELAETAEAVTCEACLIEFVMVVGHVCEALSGE